MIRSILLACTGNTCRSPMAEVLVAAKARQAGLDVVVQSAGLGAAEGIAPPEKALLAVKRLGCSLAGFRSQPVTAELVRQADLILTMTRAQLDILLLEHPEAAERAAVFLEYTGLAQGPEADVSDPLGGSQEDYDSCAELLARAAERLVHLLCQAGGEQ